MISQSIRSVNSKLLQQMLKSAKNAPVGKVGQIDLDCQFAVNHLASLYLEESVSYTGIASCRTCKNPPMTVSIPIIRLSNSLKPDYGNLVESIENYLESWCHKCQNELEIERVFNDFIYIEVR